MDTRIFIWVLCSVLKLLITDRIRMMGGGNIFTGVSQSVHRGGGGGVCTISIPTILSLDHVLSGDGYIISMP